MHLIDLGGYGPPMNHDQLADTLKAKGNEPLVKAMMQVLALLREQSNVDAGNAAVEGKANVNALSGGGEALRKALADLHTLLNGGRVEWLLELLGGRPRPEALE